MAPAMLFLVSGCATLSNPAPEARTWQVHPVIPGGRIGNCHRRSGRGRCNCSIQESKAGSDFRSTDCGESWTDLGNLLGEELHTGSVTCLASAGHGVAYLLTGDAHVWKSEDWGVCYWRPLGRVSNMPRHAQFHHSYSMTVLRSGTVLVSNTNPTGGHVFRSEDGGQSWQDLGPISTMALYRFEKVKEGVLVNGWAGRVYRSTDDGRTWSDRGQLSEKALYATEYLGKGIALQGGEDGRLFRSTDDGETWAEVARFPIPRMISCRLVMGWSSTPPTPARKTSIFRKTMGRPGKTSGRCPRVRKGIRGIVRCRCAVATRWLPQGGRRLDAS